jgi:cytochrome P450
VKGKNFQLLPFGCGQRMCVGLPLGLMIFQLALARLFHGFTLKLPIGENPQKIDMGDDALPSHGVKPILSQP